MGFIKILTVTSALIISHSALADPKHDTKSHSLIAMWSSWIKDLKPKAESSAWPELPKISTRFHIETQASQFKLRKGDKMVLTISPVGMSLNSRF
ncbi:MAG: hypothetical protein ACJA1I_001349 [Zhongshania marina]|jgi:hypothetical protein|uniref:Uncharacterized protein n=1 Tax=Zhongshania marina TaxID=2304603 RepID=A0A2S4HGU3_9GAMM|nr:hypothetical protein [Marortus luteolus]POP53203.1 hypothetical protein C0068_08960 [Marortus luteolus]RNL58931.1 hypothetical protein D0911_16895 [Zhongshania marina]